MITVSEKICLRAFLGVEKIIEYLEEAKHVFEVEIPERISSKTLEEFRAKLNDNKPKKKAKGKKKKK